MSRIIDISVEISSDMVLWPESRPVRILKTCSIDDGQIANSSSFEMSMHTGTHIDVPLHFVANGKSTSTIELDKFIGRAKVFNINTEQNIDSAQLEKFNICQGDTVLLNIAKNNNLLADKTFHKDYVSLNADGAKYLINKKIKAVGINYYSIEAFDSLPGCPVHTTLLRKDIVVIEAIKLESVEQGEYSFVCLPLKFRNGNGSPVRAILIED